LLPFILVRAVFGLVVTSFVLRPLLRAGRRHHGLSASLAWGNPLLSVTALLLGALDSLVMSFGLSRLLSGDIPVQACQLYLDSGASLRTVAHGFWITLSFGINYFIETSSTRLR
jgi:hypothetical protein